MDEKEKIIAMVLQDHLAEAMKSFIGVPDEHWTTHAIAEVHHALDDLKAKGALPGITGIKVERVSDNEIRLGCVLHGNCRDSFLESYLRKEEGGRDSGEGPGDNSSGL